MSSVLATSSVSSELNTKNDSRTRPAAGVETDEVLAMAAESEDDVGGAVCACLTYDFKYRVRVGAHSRKQSLSELRPLRYVHYCT